MMRKIYLYGNGERAICTLEAVDEDYVEEMLGHAENERNRAAEQLADIGNPAPFWTNNGHYEKAIIEGKEREWQNAADEARRSQARKATGLAKKYQDLADAASAAIT